MSGAQRSDPKCSDSRDARMPDSDADQVIVVFTTVGSEDQANSISEELVQRNLAACVNVVPAIKSVYRWKGKIWQDEEFLLIIKTTRQAFQALRRAIKTLHSYDLPELLAIPAAMGDDAVLDWIRSVVKPDEES